MHIAYAYIIATYKHVIICKIKFLKNAKKVEQHTYDHDRCLTLTCFLLVVNFKIVHNIIISKFNRCNFVNGTSNTTYLDFH